MSDFTRDDADRASNARFVRNLALSLSGGALLTVFAAGAAHAEDLGDAGTVSDGTAGSKSGDATAIGNQSGTDSTQGLGAAGGGGVQVINQTGSTTNVGIGVANTGGNIAVGNSSNNTVTGNQTANNAGGLLGVSGAVNNGTASNSSNGSAYVLTGDATAVGNRSMTKSAQHASTPAGSLGGLVLINQNAHTLNAGVGVANTGLNAANGNDSTNTGLLNQIATSTGGGLATNSGAVGNRSNGLATIRTGDGSATGNLSESDITQEAAGSGGDFPGGLTVIDQTATPVNVGLGVANTGGNLAAGNVSTSNTTATQVATGTFAPALSLGVVSNSADVVNDSNGSAEITTGDAWATGNESNTTLVQSAEGHSDLLSTAIVTQDQLVLNGGLGLANSGGNVAVGNATPANTATSTQVNTASGMLTGVVANQLSSSNASDGSAAIHTGDATAHGNVSETELEQHAVADGEGLNLISQTSVVGNGGVGVANSGLNAAVGNASTSTTGLTQVAALPDPGAPGGVLAAYTLNGAQVDSASDGSASIHTGDATATGNDSHTAITQTDPTVSVQVAAVANAGLGLANSGLNVAAGNVSTSTVPGPVQVNNIAPGDLVAGQVVQSNQLAAGNTSDGSAAIATGDATGTGNRSHTAITQDSESTVDGLGLVLGVQVAGVANVGVGVANSGVNAAVGNASTNDIPTHVQVSNIAPAGTLTAGQVISNQSGSATNHSDGSAAIRTGNATGTGNESHTDIDQTARGSIDGLGLVLNVQAAGVLNAGVGVGNSGFNAAVGNASTNTVTATQVANVAPGADLTAGQVVANNALETGNSSDGSAKVDTGNAAGTGNTSRTVISQDLDSSVDGMGLVFGPQLAGVANVGVGLANSGGNLAVGNASTNSASLVQVATFGPPAAIVTPSLIVSNQGSATNDSDGEACVCTGNATASGNISDTTLSQDTDLSVDDGLSVVPTVGGVLNAGFGVANSGLNLAVGNISTNTVTGTQVATVDPALAGLVAPQLVSNAGSLSNSSDGTGKVGTGNATAIGNLSSTQLAQATDIDGPGVFATVLGGTTNTGVGLANAGLSAGIGNASTNSATLTQVATGAGIVSNSGEASNESDGTGIVGDPDCEDEVVVVTPPEETPEKPETPAGHGLPRTGGPIELEVMAAVMLLLAGFGFRRSAKAIS